MTKFLFASILLSLIIISSCGSDEDNKTDEVIIPSFVPEVGATSPETYDGMTLVWQDEFTGSSLSTSDWNYEIGTGNNGWGNNELQYYTNTNAAVVANDYLVITAKSESLNGSNYTSSRITTQDKFEFKYGRVDIRASLPEGKGLWPALWMLGASFNTIGWPSCGEIDIMESGQGGNDDKVLGTTHWDNAGQYASYGGDTSFPDQELTNEFHVFSITWDNNSIEWLIDDVQFHVISTSPSDLDEFREEFFLIFNVAVGGHFPGNPDGTASFPQRMVVDYVRVFQDN